jgi:hypothetical protein
VIVKVVFVYFDFMKGAGGKYYEGIASISAVLRQSNHVTKLFHITDYISGEQFLDTYARRYADFDIAAFSATTNAFYYTAGYAKEIKKRLEASSLRSRFGGVGTSQSISCYAGSQNKVFPTPANQFAGGTRGPLVSNAKVNKKEK